MCLGVYVKKHCPHPPYIICSAGRYYTHRSIRQPTGRNNPQRVEKGGNIQLMSI
jgi:hypothetical protein